MNKFKHDLLSFSRNVSAGLDHLSRKHFVHRDLAARNILVSSDYVCKVSNIMGLGCSMIIVCHRLLTLEWHEMLAMTPTIRLLEERYQ